MLPPLRPSVPWVRATTTASAPDPIAGSPSPGVERRPSLLPPLRPLCPPVTRARSVITNAAAGPGPFTGPPSPGLACPGPGLASSELPLPPPSGAPSGPPPSGPAPTGPAPTGPPPSDAPVPTAVAKRQDSSELPPPPPSGVPSGPPPSGPAPTGPLPSDAPRPGFASPRPGVAQSTTTTRAAAVPGSVPGPPSPGVAQSTTTTRAAAGPGPVPGPPSPGVAQSTNGFVHDPNRPHWRDLPPDWRDPVTGANRHGHIPNAHRRGVRRRRNQNRILRAENPVEADRVLAERTRRWEQRRR